MQFRPLCPKIRRGQRRLTPEQQVSARQFIQERCAAQLSPEADEQAAETHLLQAYQVAGLPPPQILWFDSPLAFYRAFVLLDEQEEEH